MEQEDRERRIEELQDELKRRDARISELTEERDAEREVLREMREHVADAKAMIERWIEGFDMELDDKGRWQWRTDLLSVAHDALWERYQALRSKWNKFVGQYNAAVASQKRNFGRPLGASPAQCAAVLKRRKAGEPLRSIADETGLSLQTVRTIIDKADGVDRATLARLERIAPDKMVEARARAGRKLRAGLPRKVNELLEAGSALQKKAKGL